MVALGIDVDSYLILHHILATDEEQELSCKVNEWLKRHGLMNNPVSLWRLVVVSEDGCDLRITGLMHKAGSPVEIEYWFADLPWYVTTPFPPQALTQLQEDWLIPVWVRHNCHRITTWQELAGVISDTIQAQKEG